MTKHTVWKCEFCGDVTDGDSHRPWACSWRCYGMLMGTDQDAEEY